MRMNEMNAKFTSKNKTGRCVLNSFGLGHHLLSSVTSPALSTDFVVLYSLYAICNRKIICNMETCSCAHYLSRIRLQRRTHL